MTKWLATLQANITAEIDVTQQMANRVKQLEERRYSTQCQRWPNRLTYFNDKVATHLKAMGLEWQSQAL